jgi:hypothetical protein
LNWTGKFTVWSRRSVQSQWQGGDDDNITAGDDFPTTPHKLEFLKFDSSGNPLPWLNRCERYFHVHGTPEHQRVAFAAFYLLLDDA